MRLVALSLPFCVLCLACPRAMEPPADAPAAKKVIGKKTVPLKKLAQGDDDEKKDEPVYPPDAAPLPLAEELCQALFTLRAERKAECCEEPKPSSPITKRCTSTISAALAGGAVSLDEAAVKRCAAALDKQFTGCDWVRTIPHPRPIECSGLFTPALKAGDACRSSLECPTGLSCAGVGPMDKGQCMKPLPAGAPCGTAVDPLAGFIGDEGAARAHPQCAGYCAVRRCADAKPLGAACKRPDECGRSAHCAGGKCVAGETAAAGEPCTGGGCAHGARCLGDTCVAPRPAGASCRIDQECVGACVRDKGADEGTCGTRCQVPL